MKQLSLLLIFTVLVVHVYAAPQFITFEDGKLGVNFGGYHAGVGLGGLLGGGGTRGGLFAEAGTPHGQAAKAGLGGALDPSGRAAGGLYAGATAGGNVKASAGLAGGLTPEKTAGSGYASAQAGNHVASSGLGGETSAGGASGFTFAGTKSFGVSNGVINEKEISVQPVQNIAVNSVEKEVHTNFIPSNEVKSVPLTSASRETQFNSGVTFKTNSQPAVLFKEVYVQPPPVVEKHVVHTHYKPHRRLFHNTAYIGGYLGAEANVPTPPQSATYVYKTVQPTIEKRIDIGGDSSAEANGHAGGAGQVTYTKQVSVQRNPTFFADIFNIPISTLRAVGNFLSNTAANTNVSVQKSSSVQAGGEVGDDLFGQVGTQADLGSVVVTNSGITENKKKTSTSLTASVTTEKSNNNDYTTVQAGNHIKSSELNIDASVEGSPEYTVSDAKSSKVSNENIKQEEIYEPSIQIAKNSEEKKTHTSSEALASKEVKFVPLTVETTETNTGIEKIDTDIAVVQQQVVLKESIDASVEGSPEYTVSDAKSSEVSNDNIKQEEIYDPSVQIAENPEGKTAHTSSGVFASNEVKVVPLTVEKTKTNTGIQKEATDKAVVQQQVVIKEVYLQPPSVVEKHTVQSHYKSPSHHFYKTAYIGGFYGDAGPNVPFLSPPEPIVYTIEQPVVQETFQRSPTVFDDILNIPISTLDAAKKIFD